MKLPSITQAVAAARETFFRFPLVLLDAFLGTIAALIIADAQGSVGPTVWFPILYAAALGFPLLTGLALIGEKWKWPRGISWSVQCAGVIVLGLYALTVPMDMEGAPEIHTLRLAALLVGTILFAFSAPYIRHERELGYWNYCRTLCLRIVTSGLFTVVLWIGLAVALAALDKLFDVKIPSMRYPELWILLNGIFATWFVLAGVPRDLDALDSMTDYPKGLKIFSQYILLPLVLVYVVILYAYLGKILLAWDWPQGWVSSIILGFIAMGFVSLLLLHPVRGREENVWIDRAARSFYVIIIPLTVMLFLAIWRRVSEYAITEDRYLGFATVAWLCIVTAYFLFSRGKKILFLALSMCVVAFVISVGPWGMFAVSERSQIVRLGTLLRDNHILVDGKVQMKHDAPDVKTARAISSILAYLSRVHGYDAIQPWFAESLKHKVEGRADAYKIPSDVALMMGVQYVAPWENPSNSEMTLRADQNAALEIGGYDRLMHNVKAYPGIASRTFTDAGIALQCGKPAGVIILTRARDLKTVDSLDIDVQPLADSLVAEFGGVGADKIPPAKMTIEAAGKTMMIKVLISSIRIRREGMKNTVISFDADIAYRDKPVD